MSPLELSGSALNLAAVWLTTRRSVLAWPVGLAGVALFAVLFHRIRLYADALEQIYYFATGIWGWIAWSSGRRGLAEGEALPVSRLTPRARGGVLLIVAAGTALLGALTARLHLLWPGAFPEPASYPYLDAGTTAASFVAQWLTVRRFVENWHLWIGVNLVGVVLYGVKGVPWVAGTYFLFLLMAFKGLRDWRSSLPK